MYSADSGGTNEIMAVLEKKMQGILDKTKLQHGALLGGDIELLLKITDEKQAIMDDMFSCSEQHKELVLNKEAGKKLREIYKQVSELDEENRKLLAEMMEQTKEDIKRVNLNKKGINAYMENMKNSLYL